MNFSHGQYFYSLFSETINQQLLKNLDVIIVRLMESSLSNPQMVLHLLFKRTKSKGNIRSNNFIIVLRGDVYSKVKSTLGWISDRLLGWVSGFFLSWPTGPTIMVSGNLTLVCDLRSNWVESAYLSPLLKSMDFRMSLHSTSDQKSPFKGQDMPINCAFLFIAEWSQSMWLGFVLDKTKLKNKLQQLMGIWSTELG